MLFAYRLAVVLRDNQSYANRVTFPADFHNLVDSLAIAHKKLSNGFSEEAIDLLLAAR